jgi:hypothetical protein
MHTSESHMWWRPKLSALLWLLAIVLLTQLLEYYGWLASANGKVLDFFLQKNSSGSETKLIPGRPVVTVEIDDDAYAKCFGGRSPMEPAQVARLVELVQEAGAPVIGVDIFTESPWYTDNAKKIAGKSTIVWAADSNPPPRVFTPWFPSWLIGKEDKIVADPSLVLGANALSTRMPDSAHWALPLFPRDDDATIRRLPLEVTVSTNLSDPESGRPWPQFARLVASEYCAYALRSLGQACPAKTGDEILVSYGAPPPYEFRVSDFFDCNASSPQQTHLKEETRDLFEHEVKNRAVLIGGTFGTTDVHDSPLGPMPGLRINALAMEAQIINPASYAVRQPYALFIDLVLGLAFVLFAEWIAYRGFSPLLELFGPFVVLIGAVFFLIAILGHLQYVPGIVTVFVGLLIHQAVHAHERALESEPRPTHTPRSSHPASHQE